MGRLECHTPDKLPDFLHWHSQQLQQTPLVSSLLIKKQKEFCYMYTNFNCYQLLQSTLCYSPSDKLPDHRSLLLSHKVIKINP